MIEINGEPVKVQEVIKRFDVPVPTNDARSKDRVFFGANRRKDLHNGGVKFNASITAPTEFVGKDRDGLDIHFRYYQRKRVKTNKGITENVYTPVDMGIHGETKRFDTQSAVEEFIFMYLHIWNADSPLRTRKDKRRWFMRDDVKTAKETVNNSKKLLECLNLIHGTDIEILRQKAIGLKMSGIDGLENEQVIAALEVLIYKDPTAFLDKWEDSAVRYRGIIKTALDRGIIIFVEDQDHRVYKYAAAHYKGEDVCTIRRSDGTPFETLLNHCAGHFNEVTKKIEGLVNQGSTDERLRRGAAKSGAGDTTRDLVTRMIETGVIYLDPVTGEVWSLKGKARDKKIIDVKDSKDWADVVSSHLSEKNNSQVLKSLKAKLGFKERT